MTSVYSTLTGPESLTLIRMRYLLGVKSEGVELEEVLELEPESLDAELLEF